MSNQTTTNHSLSFSWQVCIAVMLSAAVIVAPDFAFAQIEATNSPFGNVFCTVAGWFTGSAGKGLATIAITIIGIGALLGKVSWGMALIVGTGVAIIFGAVGIVNVMGAGAEGSACDIIDFANVSNEDTGNQGNLEENNRVIPNLVGDRVVDN